MVQELKLEESRARAFEVLVNTYKERLYWHIRRIVLNHDDTDDVLQNTFIKIYRNIEKFKGDSKLYSWMYRIATNESLTFLKQKSRKMGVSNQELKDRMVENLEADVYFDGDEIGVHDEVFSRNEIPRYFGGVGYIRGSIKDILSFGG